MEANGNQQPKHRPLLKATIIWMRDLFLSVIIAVAVILFLFQPLQVEGTSMMPSLEDQDRIFINKFIYRLGIGEVERGDTVVFWFPGDTDKSYIKRIIGLPGDVVSIQEGAVTVNGIPLEEKYVPEQYRDGRSSPPLEVPPDNYYVLGDHRNSSNDSRNWGPLPRSYIYGKAVFAYWPPDKMGPLD